MDQLPSYSSLVSPPTYEASVYAAEHDESIWPRNYGRQTPRINVAKFYHNLVLNSPQLYESEDEYDEYDDDSNKYYCRSPTEYEEVEEPLPPSPPSSPALLSFSSSSSSVSSLQLSSRASSSTTTTSSLSSLLDHHHHHTITELNRLLIQTWSNGDNSVPSYEAFKAKVNSHDLRPIPNTFL